MGRTLSILRICAPRIARSLLWPWAIACAVTWLALRGHPDTSGDPVDSAMLWLQLPLTVLTIAVVLATLEAWPGFGRDRPESDLLDRLRLGPLDGCGVAALAGCALGAGLMLVTGLGFELLSGRDSQRRIDHSYRLHGSGGAQLVPGGSLRFELPEPTVIEAIELRPRMPLSPEGGFETSTIRLLDQDGAPLGADQPVERHGQRITLRFAPRRLGAIEVRHLGDGLPLGLPADALRARRATSTPALVNTALAALSAALATALTLALLLLGRHRLSLGVAATAGMALPLLWNLSGLAPQTAAIAACARQQWSLDDATLERSFWSLSIALVAMLSAVVIRRPRDAR